MYMLTYCYHICIDCKSSKVSSLLDLLYKMNIELAFEKFQQILK